MAENTQSFDETALVHLDVVFRAAMALCGQRDVADDLVQTTFVKAWQRFDTFRPGSNAKAWLFQILRNQWIDQLRRREVAGSSVPLEEDRVDERVQVTETVWSNAHDLLENFADDQVIRALGRLPEDQRLVLYLVDVEQMSHKDVAEIVGVAVGTIKSRTSRARSTLKQELMEYAREMGFVDRR